MPQLTPPFDPLDPANQSDYTNPHGVKIPGYRKQSPETLELVASLKRSEEQFLRTADELADYPGIDKRWLAIGNTHIQQGFMAIVRALMQPQRIKLPGDPADG